MTIHKVGHFPADNTHAYCAYAPCRKLSLRSSFMMMGVLIRVAIYPFARYISRLDCSPAIKLTQQNGSRVASM